MTDDKFAEMSNTEVEEMWVNLANAPAYFKAKQSEAASARLVVLKELIARGYTQTMCASMVGLTVQAVSEMLRSRARKRAANNRRRSVTVAREEAKKAKRELAMYKALNGEGDGHTYPSPI